MGGSYEINGGWGGGASKLIGWGDIKLIGGVK